VHLLGEFLGFGIAGVGLDAGCLGAAISTRGLFTGLPTGTSVRRGGNPHRRGCGPGAASQFLSANGLGVLGGSYCLGRLMPRSRQRRLHHTFEPRQAREDVHVLE
jgi:hypothetical protein